MLLINVNAIVSIEVKKADEKEESKRYAWFDRVTKKKWGYKQLPNVLT